MEEIPEERLSAGAGHSCFADDGAGRGDCGCRAFPRHDDAGQPRQYLHELLLAGTMGGKAPSVAYTMGVSDVVRKAYAAAGGNTTNYGKFGLHQTNSNTILISDNTKIGELKDDFLGVTQASYRDAVDWSESPEAQAVRVVTLENSATLTLGKVGSTGGVRVLRLGGFGEHAVRHQRRRHG